MAHANIHAMPNTKSAQKALRQNVRKRTANIRRKTALKQAVKEFKKNLTAQNKEGASVALTRLFKTADKVAKSNFIHKNKAGRIKARATRAIAKAFPTS